MKSKCAYLITSTLVALVCSCSIIQDSDIKSAAEAANLKLTSIQIDQVTQTNGSSTATMTPTVDKSVNISTSAGLLTRYVEFNAPSFSATSKIKYRTSVADGSKIYVYYFSSGKPSALGIYKENVVNGKVKDSTFYEVYRFRYDASGRLNKFMTFLNPTAAPTSNDTLIYGAGNQVATVLRRGTNPIQVITIQYQGPLPAVSTISVAPSTNPSATTKSINGANACFTCASESSSSLNYSQSGQNQGTGGGNGPLTITLNNLVGKPQNIQLENLLNVGSGPDTYYFHPLMVLYGQVPAGNPLLHIYTIDWWKLGTVGGSTANNNAIDKVKFTFNYVKQ